MTRKTTKLSVSVCASEQHSGNHSCQRDRGLARNFSLRACRPPRRGSPPSVLLARFLVPTPIPPVAHPPGRRTGPLSSTFALQPTPPVWGPLFPGYPRVPPHVNLSDKFFAQLVARALGSARRIAASPGCKGRAIHGGGIVQEHTLSHALHRIPVPSPGGTPFPGYPPGATPSMGRIAGGE